MWWKREAICAACRHNKSASLLTTCIVFRVAAGEPIFPLRKVFLSSGGKGDSAPGGEPSASHGVILSIKLVSSRLRSSRLIGNSPAVTRPPRLGSPAPDGDRIGGWLRGGGRNDSWCRLAHGVQNPRRLGGVSACAACHAARVLCAEPQLHRLQPASVSLLAVASRTLVAWSNRDR